MSESLLFRTAENGRRRIINVPKEAPQIRRTAATNAYFLERLRPPDYAKRVVVVINVTRFVVLKIDVFSFGGGRCDVWPV